MHGTVKITDTEDFGSDEVGVWNFERSVTLEPNTTANPTLAEQTFTAWTRCTDGDVRAKVTITVRLNEHDLSAR